MTRLIAAVALLALAGPAHAQQAASQLTRDLNSGPPVATPPAAAPQAAPAPAPAAPAPRAAPVPVTTATATATPAPAPAPIAAAPAAPARTVLDAAAVAALPFRIELPTGFSVTAGRPGADFREYVIRRGEMGFVTVYAGPASQFPVYDGEMLQAGGRTSVVVAQDGGRHALEHLFQRQTAPREIHVLVSSLDGADLALAERIAQSVDPK